ncbi:hypothetical protein OAD64_00235 [Oceanospirillaceae bacterium]|nr:hypothetical protein [Oceanospirillaceae bacterium]
MASLTELQTLSEQLRSEIEEAEGTKANRIKELQAQSDSLQVDIDQGTSITPTGLSSAAAGREAGWKGLKSSYYTFRAAGNYLIGDKEDAERDLKTAGQLDNQAGRIGQHIVKFADFVTDVSDSYKGTGENKEAVDLLSDFGELTAYTANQAIPSAVDSFAWALGGFVAGGLTTGGTAAVPGAVGGLVAKGQIKRAVTKAVKAYAKGEGTPEGDIVARDAIKRMAAEKARSKFGVAGAKKGGKRGALASGYIQGTASSFDESMESDIEKKDAAELAFAMGVPFAVMDYLPEMAFYKSVKSLVKGSHIKKGKYLRNLVGGVAKTGAVQGFKELGAETGQTGLMIAQRFIQDPNYDIKSATMRMSEAAFSGFVAGKSLASSGKLAGNVLGQINSTADETAQILSERRDQKNPTEKEVTPGKQQLLSGPQPRQGRTFVPDPPPPESGPKPRQGRTFVPGDETRSAGMATMGGENLSVLEQAKRKAQFSPANISQTPLADLLAVMPTDENGNPSAVDPEGNPEAAAAVQELNRRADEMGANKFMVLMRQAQKKAAGKQETESDGKTEVEREIFNDTLEQASTLPEAGATEQRTLQGELEEQPQGYQERLIGKNQKGDGYKLNSKAVKGKMAKLQEENPGRQYRIVQKDGMSFVEEVVESSFDVSEIVNDGVKKAVKGTKAEGVDRTLPATDPQGNETTLAPIELTKAGERANNKDKANASNMTYPQLLMSGFLRMNQELAERGFKIDLDSLPRETVLAQKGKTNYTWGDLQDAWAERKDTKEGSAFDGEAGRESRTIKLEERIEKLKSAKDSAKTQQLLLDAENELAELNEINDDKLDASLETDTTIMSENQARSDENKKRILDEDGNAISFSTKKGTKPKVTKKRTSENGTTAWGDVPTMFMEYVDAIKKILSIEGKINIVYRSDLASTGMPSEVIKLADNVFRRGAKAAVVQHKGQRYIVLKKLKVDNAYRQAEQLFILGHEMGHIVMWDMWTSLPQAQKDRLQKQFDKERLTKSAGAYTYTDDSAGFEEWFADQVSAWAKKQTTKPSDFSESFFKKVAKQVQQIFNRSRQFVRTQLEQGLSDKAREQLRDTKERGTLNETFEQFLDEVAGKKPDGSVNFVLVGGAEFVTSSKNKAAPRSQKRAAYAKSSNLKKKKAPDFKQFSEDPIAMAIADIIDSRAVAKLTELLSQMWGSDTVSQMLKLTLSADQYARTRLGKNGPAFANLFYKRSQEAGKDGDMLNRRNHSMDKWNAQYSEIIGEDEALSSKVLEEMQRGVPIQDSADPKMRQQLASFFERFHKDYLQKRLPKIGFIQNYFPIVYNTRAMAENPVAMLAELEKAGLSKREAKIVFKKMMQNEGAFVDEMPIPNAQVVGAKFDSRLQRKLKNMDMKAMQELGFYQPPAVAIQAYLKQATKHAEYALVEAEAAALIEQMNPKQQAQARNIVLSYMGQLGADINPKWNKFQSYVAALQFATTLLFATVASLTDAGNPIVRSKDMDGFKSAMKTWRGYISKQSREEQEAFAERIGAAGRAAIQEALAQSYGSEYMDAGARKWSDKYFTAIGLESWTRMTRVISANMAQDFITKHADAAMKGNARSLRYLKELGLTPEEVFKAYDNPGAKTTGEILDLTKPEGQKVQDAILSFVDEAIIRPNAAHRPVWASDPHYMLIWQLKSFFYSFGQVVVGGVVREAKARYKEGDKVGAMMSAGLLFGALMPLAALALQVRQVIKGVVGKEVGEEDEGILAFLFDLIDRAGILGPLSIIKAMYEAPNYGRSSVAAALGPTAGTLETFFDGDTQGLIKRLTPVYSQL